MTAPRDPAAIALGDQVHAEIIDLGRQTVVDAFAAQGDDLSHDERDLVEVGVAAGVAAAMKVLVRRGWLAVP